MCVCDLSMLLHLNDMLSAFNLLYTSQNRCCCEHKGKLINHTKQFN